MVPLAHVPYCGPYYRHKHRFHPGCRQLCPYRRTLDGSPVCYYFIPSNQPHQTAQYPYVECEDCGHSAGGGPLRRTNSEFLPGGSIQLCVPPYRDRLRVANFSPFMVVISLQLVSVFVLHSGILE
jgi:hypothetical protein